MARTKSNSNATDNPFANFGIKRNVQTAYREYDFWIAQALDYGPHYVLGERAAQQRAQNIGSAGFREVPW